MKTGELVIWHDAEGKAHDALVTCVWSDTCINVVFVSDDNNKTDNYGRQLERATSCQHVSLAGAYGYYWRRVGEEPKEYKAPQAT